MALTKCINSESKQYKPVLVDKLILDDVPTVNSLNAITSDAVARAVAGASGEVPQVTENDNGKVLKAVYDAGGPAVEWGEAAPAVTVDQTYNALSENAQSGVAVAQAIAAIPAAPVEVVTNQNSFELEGDNPVKVEFTRVEDTSVIIHTTVDLTPGSPVDGDDNQTMVIAFDLDAVNKAVDEGPVLKINTALPANSGLSQFQWGFNDSVSTSDNYSNYIQAGSNTSYGFPSGEIDLGNPGTIGTRSYSRTRGIESNTKRYFIVKAVFASTYKSAISTWMSNGNITIKDWPTDGYGNKVVIPNIPASTSADATKVLTVDSNGDPQWQTAQGGGSSPISMYSLAPTQYQLPVSNTDIAQITHKGFTLSWTAQPELTYSQISLYVSNSSIQSAYVFCESTSSGNIKPVKGGTEDPNGTKVYTPQDMSTPLKANYTAAYAGTEEYTKITVMYNDNSVVKSSTFTVLWSSSAVDLASNTYALEAKVMVVDG